jgi:hypothetical protein
MAENEGVKGMHPLGCLPLWGREGVTLIFPQWMTNKQKTGFQQTRKR